MQQYHARPVKKTRVNIDGAAKIMISSSINTLLSYSLKPGVIAEDLRDAFLDDDRWEVGLGSRALYIAQVVTSIAAMPLAILAIIRISVLILCVEGKEAAMELFLSLAKLPILHLCAIPTCLIAAFVPHSLKWEWPAQQVLDCLDPT